MKKLFIYGVLTLALLTSCDNSKEKAVQQELANQQALNEATREELQSAINERDELLALVNEVSSGIDEINEVEKIITINGGGELSTRSNLTNSLASIKSTLADRRQRLADLEKKLKDSKLSGNKLLETIESLRKQIDDQTSQIETLTASLETANRKIIDLDNQVDSLHNTVQTVTDERNAAREEAVQEANKANECFYAVGSKRELKDHNIIESGFLRKTKIMQGDFDKSYFVQGDKRTLKTIKLHSKKAKIVSTNQPSNSYEIVDVNGEKELRILNPGEFWSVSNYVVIQID